MIGGIDLSTKAIDLVAISEDDPRDYQKMRVTLGPDWFVQSRFMREAFEFASMLSFLSINNIWMVGVERPYGPSRQSIASLHTVMGAVIASLPRHITVMEVRPYEMRRELGLTAGASKAAMHEKIIERGVTEGDKPDVLDAWAVAHAALRMCERASEEGE